MTATDQERQLHHDLLDGSPTASARLAELHLGPLFRRLRARHPEVQDETLLYDAATTALLDYAEHPERYKPEMRTLSGYLLMAANGDLLNLFEKEKRRARRMVSLDAVAQDGSGRNRVQEPSVEDDIDLDRIADDPAHRDLSRRVLAEFPDPVDRRLLGLLLDGERRTDPYAVILAITGMDADIQRRAVKQHKDRLKKRLARMKGKLHDQPY